MLTLLLACTGPMPEPDGSDDTGTRPIDTADSTAAPDSAPADPDEDGDGFPASLDCNDSDPAVNPGGRETCDGVDQDCDGAVDEEAADATDWYADTDGDGFGGAFVDSACSAPEGAVALAGDCDDGDAAASPIGVETCDGTDQDCDGEIDEDEAIDAPTWYADVDGDGYGDPGASTVSCTGSGVSDGTDCDDTDAAVRPTGVETCDSRDQDCDGAVDEGAIDAPAWYTDADGDGYGDPSVATISCLEAGISDSTDCDDADASVHPTGVETCDGRDEDCDGSVDEDAIDAPVWYTDADGDGYGDPATSAVSCTGSGVSDGTDCDDTDAAVRPMGVETCDTRDQDCDGSVDEDAVDAPIWYTDADGDGYGDPSVATASCLESGSSDSTDCDDADASVHPTGVETCDGRDEDCDGAIDEDVADPPTWYADADGDGYGDAAFATEACTSTGVSDATDCDDADPDTHPGATDDCEDGVDDDCDGSTDGCPAWGTLEADDVAATLYGDWSNAHAGPIAPAGDVTGDGVDDLLVAATGWTPYVCSGCSGEAYVVAGPITGDQALRAAAWLTLTGDQYLGYDLASAGDPDGDGRADLLLGAVTTGYGSDSAWRVTGASAGASTIEAAADTEYTGLYAMTVANAGDLNGDGIEDVLVGGDSLSTGEIWLFSGRRTGRLDDGDAFAWIVGDSSVGYGLGHHATGVVDLDGDGVSDVWAASHELTTGVGTRDGGLYAFYGPFSGARSATDVDVRVGGNSSAYSGYGADVADLDGDGYPDLVLGGHLDDTNGSNAGAAWLFRGPIAEGDAADADAVVLGETEDRVGSGVHLDGDVDADGTPDLLLNASIGTAVFFGTLAGTVDFADADILVSYTVDGTRQVFAGDLDGDGLTDLATSWDQDDVVLTDDGSVFVFSGSAF